MRMDRATRWLLPIVFFGAAVATHVIQTLAPAGIRDSQGSDYAFYYRPTANSLLAGSGYSTSDGAVQTRVPPGYPLVLAAAQWTGRILGGDDAGAARHLMTLCMGLGAVAIYLVARTLWGPLSALVSAALWTTCPFVQFLTLQLGSEVPFMPVFYAAAGLLLHALMKGSASPAPFFLVGLLAGAAMLFRPIALGIGGVFALVVWWVSRGRPWRLRAMLVAAVLLGNAAVVIPWETWLYVRTGRLILLSDSGSSTLQKGWEFALRPDQPHGGPPVDPEVTELMQEFATVENGGSLRAILGVLVRESFRNPGAVARLIFLKLTRCWYGTESFRFARTILLVQAFYLPLLLFACWRGWCAGGARRLATLSVVLLILYFWGMAFLFIPLLRFLTPVQGLALAIVPAAFLRSRDSIRTPA